MSHICFFLLSRLFCSLHLWLFFSSCLASFPFPSLVHSPIFFFSLMWDYFSLTSTHLESTHLPSIHACVDWLQDEELFMLSSLSTDDILRAEYSQMYEFLLFSMHIATPVNRWNAVQAFIHFSMSPYFLQPVHFRSCCSMFLTVWNKKIHCCTESKMPVDKYRGSVLLGTEPGLKSLKTDKYP